MGHFCRHANALAQLGLQVDGFADAHSVCAHLNRQSDLANHVARVRAHPVADQDLAVASRLLSNSSFVTLSSLALALARPETVHGSRLFFTFIPCALASV
jgi:hypothetical protein